ncbi:MAG: hypothetical protein HYZ63_02215 [Candidatus Andersenbacteria bacterium]|nr:hypothetical protein [Candidatus Andersenbacteria bacterium]
MERNPKEKETLMFATPEAAQAWREGVGEKLAAQPKGRVRRDKEIVGEAVADQFSQHGEAASITHPWEHTPAEHEEVQLLVDMAFAEDLPTALRAAKKSPTYPRNLDLFHDLLTNEMYELVRQTHLTKQPLGLWLTEVAVIILLAALGVLLLIAVAL